MGELESAGDSRRVPGQVLITDVGARFAEGMAVTTAEGGWLTFRRKEQPYPSDFPPSVYIYLLSAVAPIRDPGWSDNVDVFSFTTALVDADGQLWQRTRIVSIFEIWRKLLERPVFGSHFEAQEEYPVYPTHMERVSRRVLLEPIQTICDMREHLLVEILRKSNIEPAPAAAAIPAEPPPKRGFFGFGAKREKDVKPPPAPAAVTGAHHIVERLLFRFRFKYFGARIGLVEDQIVCRITTAAENRVSYSNEVTFTILPTTEADLIAALGANDKMLPTKGVRLTQLGTLSWSRASHPLAPGWDMPAQELVRRGDLAAWQKAYEDIGADPAKLLGFKPNPEIRYLASLG